MRTETIQIEKIDGGLKKALLSLNWKVKKRIGDIQHYSVHTPFMSEEGAMIDDIHIRFPEHEIGIILPFTDKEKICWECGGQRILELTINVDCFCMTWFDWCYNPQHERVEK